MSAVVGEFEGGTIAAGGGALDTVSLSLERFAPVLFPADPKERPVGPVQPASSPRGGRSQAPEEKDVMVRALRKESVDPEAPRSPMQSEAAPTGATEIGKRSETASPTDPESASPPAPPDAPVGWAGMLVQLLAIALVAAGIALVALKASGLLTPPQVRVVTFDVLKYENAERAQAMKLMGQGGAGAVAPMLSYVSKRLRVAIQKAAGPGTLVVLSQAVVQGQTRDITDAVLRNLGLPTKVPTATALKALAIGPSTMAPPVSANQNSPLSRLVNSGSHTKSPSIIP